ncbi:protein of unknown function [Pseudorhizobium banfieldiae]|uniref:Uncharacterized protein n=2 Tax=Pseudorhizobium banfieldiae TaxID=1125847 RepID=L0NFW3_9HYPH|nr:protein of unknown function [Pseudorhizobium banfieldiae]
MGIAMKIKSYGHFTPYQGDVAAYAFFRNEHGHDWYDLQRGKVAGIGKLVELGPKGAFVKSPHAVWLVVDPEGRVINVEVDPSRIVPRDKTVLGIDGASPGDFSAGMIFQGGQILPAPPAPPAPYYINKETPWMRMTDEEAEAVDVAYNAASVRFRQSYNSAVSLRPDTALWDEWRTILVGVLGEPRTDQLLERE